MNEMINQKSQVFLVFNNSIENQTVIVKKQI